jgi:molybdopterin biosynthesis enzyme
MNVDDNEEVVDLHDHFYDQIICRRNIARRTNWRHRANALSQHEVALAAGIQLSANDCVTVISMICKTVDDDD